MNHTAIDTPAPQIAADALIVTLAEDNPLEGPAAELNEASGGVLAALLESGELGTRLGDVTPLLALPGVSARVVFAVGLGKREKLAARPTMVAIGSAARKAAERKRERVAFALPDDWDGPWQEMAVSAAIVGCQGQDLYRAEKKRFPFESVLWRGVSQAALESGRILGESINLTRRLVNEPPDRVYPQSVAETAVELAAEVGLEVEVWDQQRLEQERCGCLLAVARGSAKPARLAILSHRGGAPEDPLLALVGKGVTFDSGGLSIKPSEGMQTMKCDMAGAATVLGAMRAIAQLKLPINVIGLVGLVENLISGDAYKLGDVLTARNGKTVEVLNTDAEGRLVLADVLDVARERGATRLIDLATLTGACVVALGNDVAGLMTNDQSWCDVVADSARRSGELAWQLPMFDHYGKQILSEIADIKNIGEGRWGGAITAAKFLEQFVGDTPWTHIDIAGPSFADKPKSWTEGGGTGAFVRTLVEVARRWPAVD